MKTINQKGFTLIELVIVIVILGILAATAAPKFINLQGDAHKATLDAVKASMESAAAIVHSKSLIAGNQNAAASDSPTVVVDGAGTTVNLHKGYPTNAVAEWAKLLDIDTTNDFSTHTTGTTGSGTAVYYVYPQSYNEPGSGDPDACYVSYTETNTPSTKPAIAVVSSEC